MIQRLANWMTGLKRQEGQTLVEYILIICLIAVVVAFALVIFGQGLYSIYIFVYNQIAAWCGCL